MTSARIELLQRMPIFGAISDDALEFLLAQARNVEFRKDEFLFRENDPANSMFVLEAGRVAVFKSWHKREMLLRHLGVGDCVGEMALMDLYPRSASVRAVEPTSAIELSSADLHRLYEHDVEQFALIQMNIGREVCRRLRVMDDLMFRTWVGDTPVAASAGDVFRST
jgi:CRP-like cAMP-binding protein